MSTGPDPPRTLRLLLLDFENVLLNQRLASGSKGTIQVLVARDIEVFQRRNRTYLLGNGTSKLVISQVNISQASHIAETTRDWSSELVIEENKFAHHKITNDFRDGTRK